MENQKIALKKHSQHLGSFDFSFSLKIYLAIQEVDKIYTDNKYIIRGYRVNYNTTIQIYKRFFFA